MPRHSVNRFGRRNRCTQEDNSETETATGRARMASLGEPPEPDPPPGDENLSRSSKNNQEKKQGNEEICRGPPQNFLPSGNWARAVGNSGNPPTAGVIVSRSTLRNNMFFIWSPATGKVHAYLEGTAGFLS